MSKNRYNEDKRHVVSDPPCRVEEIRSKFYANYRFKVRPATKFSPVNYSLTDEAILTLTTYQAGIEQKFPFTKVI